jgi:hypothetical protein
MATTSETGAPTGYGLAWRRLQAAAPSSLFPPVPPLPPPSSFFPGATSRPGAWLGGLACCSPRRPTGAAAPPLAPVWWG